MIGAKMILEGHWKKPGGIRISVVKHKKQHPRFGLERR